MKRVHRRISTLVSAEMGLKRRDKEQRDVKNLASHKDTTRQGIEDKAGLKVLAECKH